MYNFQQYNSLTYGALSIIFFNFYFNSTCKRWLASYKLILSIQYENPSWDSKGKLIKCSTPVTRPHFQFFFPFFFFFFSFLTVHQLHAWPKISYLSVLIHKQVRTTSKHYSTRNSNNPAPGWLACNLILYLFNFLS